MKNKFNYLLLILLSVFILTSCSMFTSTSTTNEVKKNVTYENITIADFNNMIEEASEKASNSCVAILATDSGWISTSESLGSGVIVKKEEITTNVNKYYVVTNRHVVAFTSSLNSSKETITSNVYVCYCTEESKKIAATVVGYSTEYDVALLSFTSSLDFTPVTFAEDDSLQVGSIVIACGTPLGLEYYNTISQGVVSYKSRVLNQTKFNSSEVIATPFIQHDASINSGNSGGGLFDIYGNLVGINTLQYNKTGVQGMNFALPVSIVKQFVTSKITL